jgi:beclin 1
MEDNTARLEAEIEAYDAAVKNEQDKQRRLLKALSINAGINQDEAFETSIHIQYADEEILQNALDTLDDELKRLQITNQEHESELQKMNELLQDRVRIAQTLTEQEDEVLTEFNSLEVDARVFQDIHRHFTHQCHAAEREKFHLSRVQLHSALFHIDVDERGLRYPLINNLRLAHKPSSRGISWLEINAAWSQAAQLLMFVGSTIKFKSKDLRIVPLMSCAKIIEVGSNGDTRFVNHLGVDFQAMNRKTPL